MPAGRGRNGASGRHLGTVRDALPAAPRTRPLPGPHPRTPLGWVGHSGANLVGIFPAALRGALSWREDVFESDEGRIAVLDDDAIVAAFLYAERARGDNGT